MARLFPAVVLVMMSAIAAAQPAETPGFKLWAEGRALAKEGKYAEACVKLQKSLDLEPTIGVRIGLADCQEHLGHLVVAWRLFNTAAQQEGGANADLSKLARDRADALRARLGAIELHLSAVDVATATVLIGGESVTPAAEVTEVVEPGEVDVIVSEPGKQPYRAKKKVVAGATLEVDVPALVADDSSGGGGGGGDDGTVTRRRRSRVLLAYGVGGVGLAAAVTGIIIGFKANSDYDSNFGEGMCHSATGGPMCDTPESEQGLRDARSLATVGTVVGTTGWVLVAAGAVLWYTAPKDLVVTPTATASSAGISVVGRF